MSFSRTNASRLLRTAAELKAGAFAPVCSLSSPLFSSPLLSPSLSFPDRVSLCIPGSPGTHSVKPNWPWIHRDPLTSASRVRRALEILKGCGGRL